MAVPYHTRHLFLALLQCNLLLGVALPCSQPATHRFVGSLGWVEEHDFLTKMKQMNKFLAKGNQVKLFIKHKRGQSRDRDVSKPTVELEPSFHLCHFGLSCH
jgi:hypothetical protein